MRSNKGIKSGLIKIKPYLTFIITAIAVYGILTTAMIGKKYELEVGEIAKNDIKAPKDVEDKVTTQKNIEEQLNHVQNIYTYDSNVKTEVSKNIDELFKLVENVNAQTTPGQGEEGDTEKAEKAEQEKLRRLKSESPIKDITDDDYKKLLEMPQTQLKQLRDDLVRIMENLYDTVAIYDGNEDNISAAQTQVANDLAGKAYSSEISDLGIAIAKTQIKTTYFLDEEKTEEARQAAIKNVTPVTYKKDQTIVAEGQPVTEAQIAVLTELGLLNNEKSTSLYMHLAIAAIVLVILGLEWNYIKIKNNSMYKNSSILVLINLLTIFNIAMARIIGGTFPYMIPFACISILLSVLVDEKIATIIGVMNVVFISIIVSFVPQVMLIALLNAVIVPVIIDKVQQRNDILYSGIKIGVINIVFTAIMGYFLSADILSIVIKSLMTGAAALISGILAIGTLPILENIFDIVTNMKLLELSNPNHPLMRRLLLEAPGTYHHSVLVANLAEMAAEKVGANPTLARVAAYYHDVGKLERPYYFKENQVGGDNPHDKMSPSLSAAIILSHVEDGVKLANRYNLPKVIIDVIREHHGDSLAKYFYITMRNQSENPDEIDKNDYKYKGPAPTSKESSIVMMADGVEASVRSIKDPTNEKIQKMVNDIFKTRIEENQLINSELTFKDIEKIKESFLKVLSGIYHERISYPKDKLEMSKKTKTEFLNSRRVENDEDMKIYSKKAFRRGAK